MKMKLDAIGKVAFEHNGPPMFMICPARVASEDEHRFIERLVACWNALNLIPTETIKSGLDFAAFKNGQMYAPAEFKRPHEASIRAAACVKACAGIPTDKLTAGSVAILVGGTRRLLDDLSDSGEDRNQETDEEYDSVTEAKAAIAPFE